MPSFQAHFMPAVEIGWFLGVGKRAMLLKRQKLFTLCLSFTVAQNLASRRVMEKDDLYASAIKIDHQVAQTFIGGYVVPIAKGILL